MPFCSANLLMIMPVAAHCCFNAKTANLIIIVDVKNAHFSVVRFAEFAHLLLKQNQTAL